MDIETKKLVEKGDFRALKYLFVDALDVDPTFEQFEGDYQYCKSVSGLWEPYQELTPLRSDPKEWDEDYWVHLKVDLAKNFSDRRLSHMRQVAKVVLAEKVRRIQAERNARAAAAAAVPQEAAPRLSVPEAVEKELAVNPEDASVKPPMEAAGMALSRAEQEKLRLAEKKRQLEEENRKIQAEKDRQEREMAAKRERLRREQEQTAPKKVLWIVVATVVLAVIVLLLIGQGNPN